MGKQSSAAETTRPSIQHFVSTGLTTRLVREFVRETMVPDAIERIRAIGMGETEHPIPVVVPGGKHGPPRVEVIDVPAPPAVQVQALSKLIDTGAPRPRAQDGEGVKIAGVIVFGEEGPQLVRARELAARQRQLAQGSAAHATNDYKPPPGHQVMVIDDDLSGSKHGPSPDDAPAPPTARKPTKAQEIAARRKAQRQKKR